MVPIKQSIKTGLGFGLTSGIITTLGLIVGLNSGTHSRAVVISGILVIAVADAFSDALGIHISEESDGQANTKEIWESTISTFLAKFLVAISFLVPVLMFELTKAMTASMIWGLFLIGGVSFFIAKEQSRRAFPVVTEHIIITILVICASYYIGTWINTLS